MILSSSFFVDILQLRNLVYGVLFSKTIDIHKYNEEDYKFDNEMNNSTHKMHQWSSGRMVRCHGTNPGSIVGWCM